MLLKSIAQRTVDDMGSVLICPFQCRDPVLFFAQPLAQVVFSPCQEVSGIWSQPNVFSLLSPSNASHDLAAVTVGAVDILSVGNKVIGGFNTIAVSNVLKGLVLVHFRETRIKYGDPYTLTCEALRAKLFASHGRNLFGE